MDISDDGNRRIGDHCIEFIVAQATRGAVESDGDVDLAAYRGDLTSPDSNGRCRCYSHESHEENDRDECHDECQSIFHFLSPFFQCFISMLFSGIILYSQFLLTCPGETGGLSSGIFVPDG
jgi:hypothetical protein